MWFHAGGPPVHRENGQPINPIVEMPFSTATGIPGEEVWPTQPVPVKPPAFARQAFTEAEVELASVLAGQGAVAWENALLFRQVEDLASRDGLTGLFNRRRFEEELERCGSGPAGCASGTRTCTPVRACHRAMPSGPAGIRTTTASKGFTKSGIPAFQCWRI